MMVPLIALYIFMQIPLYNIEIAHARIDQGLCKVFVWRSHEPNTQDEL